MRHWFLVNEPDQKGAEVLAEKFASERYTLADPTDGYDAIAAVAPLSTETIEAMGVAPSSVVFTGTIYEPRFIST